MDEAKTRIWHSQELGLASSRSPSVPPPPPRLEKPRASTPPPPPPRSKRSIAPGRLAATRIMPIERLFPGAVSQRPPHPPTLITTAPARFRTLKRIGVHLLLGTLTVVAIAAWKLPRAPARARLMPLNPVAVDAPLEGASAREHVEQETSGQAAPAPAASRVAGGSKHKELLQRRAVELVIAGDYAGAEDAYRALARERPDSAVFREAARILLTKAAKRE